MLRAWQLALVTGLAAAMVVPAVAQEGGRRRGGFGGGGFGGFGIFQLAGIEQVQKELELVDEQKAEITKVGEEMRAQFQGGGQGTREEFEALSEEERNARFEEMRKRMEENTKAAEAKLEEILLPPQLDRLKQIRLQVQGTRALAEPEVAEALGITEDQQTQLTAVREDVQKQMGELFGQGGQGGGQGGAAGGGGEGREKMQEIMRKAEESVLAVLTEEQKAKFEEMKGEKFELDMSQLRGRGRGGRRGGGAGGAPGGQPAPQQ